MAAPLQLPFIFMIKYITGKAIITPAFVITYYCCCTVQVALMLYLGYMFVHLLWKWGFNPDNNSIPILTALADLMGSSLFALGFLFLYSIQDSNAFNDDLPVMANATTTAASIAAMSSTTLSPLGQSFLGNLTHSNLTTTPAADATMTTIASTLVSLVANSTLSPIPVLN